jgi:hypothetical protein
MSEPIRPQRQESLISTLLKYPRTLAAAVTAVVLAGAIASQAQQSQGNPVLIEMSAPVKYANISGVSYWPDTQNNWQAALLVSGTMARTPDGTNALCLPVDVYGNQLSPALTQENFPGNFTPDGTNCIGYIKEPGDKGEIFLYNHLNPDSNSPFTRKTSIVYRNGNEQRTALTDLSINAQLVIMNGEVHVLTGGAEDGGHPRKVSLLKLNKETLGFELVKSYSAPSVDQTFREVMMPVKNGVAFVATEFTGNLTPTTALYYDKDGREGRIQVPQQDFDRRYSFFSQTSDGDKTIYLHGQSGTENGQILARFDISTNTYQKLGLLPSVGPNTIIFDGNAENGDQIIRRTYATGPQSVATDTIVIDSVGIYSYTKGASVQIITEGSLYVGNTHTSGGIVDMNHPSAASNDGAVYGIIWANPQNNAQSSFIYRPDQPLVEQPDQTPTPSRTSVPTTTPVNGEEDKKVYLPLVSNGK